MKLSKFQFSPYWHLEILFIVPIVIVWTILLVIIAFK